MSQVNDKKQGGAVPGSARHYRQQAVERAALIAQLGMAPEVLTAEGRYAATAGEMRTWVREQFGVAAVEAIALSTAAVA